MKFLFDQNISHKILKLIPEAFGESTTVKHEQLINAPDIEIWEYAKKNNFVIVTQDSDFNDLNSFYGFPPKIIWIRMGNLKNMEIVAILIDYVKDIETFIDDEEFGCFEIFKLKTK
ncbi:MAG: DUF5615 family PIN-like protein [Bacteroidia bacterium]|nr:DUF5615 family PIN-like protein [Bacteroidia bacterium]